jgi:hypothetical protein
VVTLDFLSRFILTTRTVGDGSLVLRERQLPRSGGFLPTSYWEIDKLSFNTKSVELEILKSSYHLSCRVYTLDSAC